MAEPRYTDHLRVDFVPAKDGFGFEPVLTFSTDEQGMLQQKFQFLLEAAPARLRGLLQGFARLCNVEAAFDDWRTYIIPGQTAEFLAGMLMDHYRYYLNLPPEKKFKRKLSSPPYRNYILAGIGTLIDAAGPDIILSYAIGKLSTDPALVQKQLGETGVIHAGFSLPLQDTWHLVKAQDACEMMKAGLAEGRPVLLMLVSNQPDLLAQLSLLAYAYRQVNTYTLEVTGSSLGSAEPVTLHLHFDGSFHAEQFTEGGFRPLTALKTLLAPGYTPIMPHTGYLNRRASVWLARQKGLHRYNRHLKKL